MDNVKNVYTDAINALDAGFSTSAKYLADFARSTQQTVDQASTQACDKWDKTKVVYNDGLAQYQQYEELALQQIKGGLKVANEYPYVAYPAAATVTLFLVPGARRFLWRRTFGAFRNPESIMESAKSRVELLNSQLETCTNEATKLEARMISAEEEMNRGISKLKATRQELQRLDSNAYKSQKALAGVLNELREVRRAEDVLKLRGTAAEQLAAFKDQRKKINRAINHIVSRDI